MSRLCQRCGTAPVRQSRGQNTILCVDCKAAVHREHNAKAYQRRLALMRGPYSYDDIPAAEIERLYQQALKQIRARRHL